MTIGRGWYRTTKTWIPNLLKLKTMLTLQGINISHLGKRKIIFKMPFLGDMLVSWRVYWLFKKNSSSPSKNKKTKKTIESCSIWCKTRSCFLGGESSAGVGWISDITFAQPLLEHVSTSIEVFVNSYTTRPRTPCGHPAVMAVMGWKVKFLHPFNQPTNTTLPHTPS